MALRQAPLPLSILGGVLSAAPYFLLVTPSLGGMILTYFSTLPLFAVGFGLGMSSALVAGSVGVGLSIVLALLSGNLGLAIPYVGFNVIPTLLIIFKFLQFREDQKGEIHYYPAAQLMSFIAGIAIFLTLIVCAFIQTALSESHHKTAVLIQQALGPQPPETLLILTQMLNMLPGMVGISWAVMAMTNAILAQGLLKAFGYNLRSSPDICEVYPLPVFYYLLAVVGVMTFLPLGWMSQAALNIMLPVALPFLMTGMGTVHAIVRKFSYTSWILFGFYTVALMLSWPLFLLIPLGILEPWLKLRNRVP